MHTSAQQMQRGRRYVAWCTCFHYRSMDPLHGETHCCLQSNGLATESNVLYSPFSNCAMVHEGRELFNSEKQDLVPGQAEAQPDSYRIGLKGQIIMTGNIKWGTAEDFLQKVTSPLYALTRAGGRIHRCTQSP